MENFKLFCAPLQGFTEGVWRYAHAKVFGNCGGTADVYFSPFVRVEKGAVRSRDLRDIVWPLPEGVECVPQIIFKDAEEFRLLTATITEKGFNRVDLNLGCPFPPQCHKGRGAAMVRRSDVLAQVKKAMEEMPDIVFSVKMRLGMEYPYEWRDSIHILNEMRLCHVAVHPRIGRQQYKGELDITAFNELAAELCHPVVFNGDIHSSDDIDRAMSINPGLYGVMVGRGLLARPSLFAEWRSGERWDNEHVKKALLNMHEVIYNDYVERLAGESQILSKLIPFWEYSEGIIGHKSFKSIKKSRNLNDYKKVINTLC